MVKYSYYFFIFYTLLSVNLQLSKASPDGKEFACNNFCGPVLDINRAEFGPRLVTLCKKLCGVSLVSEERQENTLSEEMEQEEQQAAHRKRVKRRRWKRDMSQWHPIPSPSYSSPSYSPSPSYSSPPRWSPPASSTPWRPISGPSYSSPPRSSPTYSRPTDFSPSRHPSPTYSSPPSRPPRTLLEFINSPPSRRWSPQVPPPGTPYAPGQWKPIPGPYARPSSSPSNYHPSNQPTRSNPSPTHTNPSSSRPAPIWRRWFKREAKAWEHEDYEKGHPAVTYKPIDPGYIAILDNSKHGNTNVRDKWKQETQASHAAKDCDRRYGNWYCVPNNPGWRPPPGSTVWTKEKEPFIPPTPKPPERDPTLTYAASYPHFPPPKETPNPNAIFRSIESAVQHGTKAVQSVVREGAKAVRKIFGIGGRSLHPSHFQKIKGYA